MQKIVERIFTVEGLRLGRVYVVEGPDGLTLIDTGLSDSSPQIGQQLQTIGHTLNEIKRILITHAHQDHFGSLAVLQERTGARTYAHYRDAPIIRGEIPIPRPSPQSLQGMNRLLASARSPLATPRRAEVDCELHDADVLNEVAPGLRVVDLPGHSPGQVGFWLPDQRLMFCGDALMCIKRIERLRLPFASSTPDMAEAKRSIQKLASMDIEILCLGHGKPILKKAAAAIRAFAVTL